MIPRTAGAAVLQAGGSAPLGDAAVSLLATALLGATTLLAVGALATQPGRRRPYLVTGALVGAILTAVHAGDVVGVYDGLAPGGSGALVARLGAHAVVLGLVLAVATHVGDRPVGTSAALACLAIVHAGSLAGWVLLQGSAQTAALGVALLCLPALAVLAASALRTRPSRARRLLTARLLGVVGLAWTLALVALGLSPEALGVLDAYTAAFVGAYLDVALAAGVTVSLATAGAALDDLALGESADAAASEPDADAGAAGPDDAGTGGEPGDAAVPDGAAAARDGGTVPRESGGEE